MPNKTIINYFYQCQILADLPLKPCNNTNSEFHMYENEHHCTSLLCHEVIVGMKIVASARIQWNCCLKSKSLNTASSWLRLWLSTKTQQLIRNESKVYAKKNCAVGRQARKDWSKLQLPWVVLSLIALVKFITWCPIQLRSCY